MRLLFIDGFHLFLRNLAVIKLTDANGQSVGGFYGFLRSLRSIIEQVKPQQVFVAWEGAGGSKKRRAILSDYKDHRKPIVPPREEGMEYSINDAEKNKLWQYQKLQQYLTFLPIVNLTVDGIEADDLIGFLCQKYSEDQKIILSADQDFLQLVNSNTFLLSPIKRKLYDIPKILAEYQIHPSNFLLFRSITGDKSDNIAGIKGFGPKTVIKFFPMLQEEQKVTFTELLNYSEKMAGESGKYQQIQVAKDLIKRNFQLMDLTNLMIDSLAIDSANQKIKAQLEKLHLDIIGFRLQLAQDEIYSLDDHFLNSFKILKTV